MIRASGIAREWTTITPDQKQTGAKMKGAGVREGVAPTGNQKHQQRGLMPERARRVVNEIRSQGREGRNKNMKWIGRGMVHENVLKG